MATRFYVPVAAPSHSLTPTPDAGWNYTSEVSRGDLIRAKNDNPTSITVGSRIGPWTATAGQLAIDAQLITDPLAAQTISGTFSAMHMVREYNTADNVDRVILSVKVIDSSGSVVATLLAIGLQTGGTTTEFISNTSHRTHTSANGATLSSYSCAAGDRILIEVGYSTSGATATPEASSKWGENATDATLGNDATTANRAPWFEFSANLTFMPPTLASVSADHGKIGGGNTVTLTGSGFYSGASVTFGGNAATSVAVTSSTTITCVVPASTGGASGPVNVVVTNADSETVTLTSGYSYDVPGPTETVFSNAGGSQIVLYEDLNSAGTYTDSIGIGSAFDQPNAANRPAIDRSIAPSRRTMIYFDGNDLLGDFGTGGIIPTGSFPTWSGTKWVVEHFIIYLPSSPDNVAYQMIVDTDTDGCNRNQFGAGLIYRTGAISDSAMSGVTPYYVTAEHNVASGVTTLTVNGVTQSTTGTNSATTRADLIAYKLIGAKGDLSDGYVGHFGCFGIGYGTTWGSTERAALYQAMQDWYNIAPAPETVRYVFGYKVLH